MIQAFMDRKDRWYEPRSGISCNFIDFHFVCLYLDGLTRAIPPSLLVLPDEWRHGLPSIQRKHKPAQVLLLLWQSARRNGGQLYGGHGEHGARCGRDRTRWTAGRKYVSVCGERDGDGRHAGKFWTESGTLRHDFLAVLQQWASGRE